MAALGGVSSSLAGAPVIYRVCREDASTASGDRGAGGGRRLGRPHRVAHVVLERARRYNRSAWGRAKRPRAMPQCSLEAVAQHLGARRASAGRDALIVVYRLCESKFVTVF